MCGKPRPSAVPQLAPISSDHTDLKEQFELTGEQRTVIGVAQNIAWCVAIGDGSATSSVTPIRPAVALRCDRRALRHHACEQCAPSDDNDRL